MKKIICAALASIITASAAVPVFSSAADPKPDYVPELYYKTQETNCSESLQNGSLYINTSAISGESTEIPFELYLKDISKSLWDIRIKLKTNCPDIVFRNPRLPSDDGKTNAYDMDKMEYSYMGSYMDEDENNGKKRNYMSMSLYLYNDAEHRLAPTGENTDDYPMTLFDLLVSKDSALGSFKMYSISEKEPETEIFTDETQISLTAFRYLNKASKAVVPDSKDVKVIVSDRKLGDIDADNTIDSADASKVLEAYSKIVNEHPHDLAEGAYLASDVNDDNEVDAADASIILSYYSFIMNGNTGSLSDFIKNN